MIGLHAAPVLFRGFNRELAQTQERAGGPVSRLLLLDLFERDPADSTGANGPLPGGSLTASKLACWNHQRFLIKTTNVALEPAQSPKPSRRPRQPAFLHSDLFEHRVLQAVDSMIAGFLGCINFVMLQSRIPTYTGACLDGPRSGKL
jgi:hypothetical protein